MLDAEPYPEIVHISMHASKSKGLYFEDGLMTEEALKDYMKLVSSLHKPKLVVLSACNSIKYTEAVKPYAENVIGTVDFLPDLVSILYAKTFYQSLFNKKPIAFAHQSANLAVKHGDFSEAQKNQIKTPLHEILTLLK